MSGDEFRGRRKALGLTQADVAQAFGLTEQTIRNKEAGRVPVERRDLLALEALHDRQPPSWFPAIPGLPRWYPEAPGVPQTD